MATLLTQCDASGSSSRRMEIKRKDAVFLRDDADAVEWLERIPFIGRFLSGCYYHIFTKNIISNYDASQ